MQVGSQRVPESEEAEQAVLGGLIMSQGEAFPKVAPILSAEDFFHEEHQLIYGVIEDLYNKHSDVDQVTVLYELTSRNKADQAGGRSYISHLLVMSVGVVTEETLLFHARIVRETSVLRRMVSMVGQVQHQINSGHRSEEIIEFIHEHLNRFEAESRILVIDNLSILKSDPPIYRAKVWQHDIDFTIDEITRWPDMRKRIVSICDKVPIKHKDHDQFIHNALAAAVKIDAPLDTSAGAQLRESLERFFDRNVESDDHSDLMAGAYMTKTIDNQEYLLFYPKPLKKWLKQDLERDFNESLMWAFITNHGGINHEVRVRKGKATSGVKLWALPRSQVLSPDNAPEDF